MLVFDCLNQNSPQYQQTNPSAKGTHLEIPNGRFFDDSIPIEEPLIYVGPIFNMLYLTNAFLPKVVIWPKFIPLQLIMSVNVHD